MKIKRHEMQHNLAMTVVLIMMSMLFATLFMGYAIYRTSADMWPPMGIQKVSLLLPSISTLMIFISSCFLYQAKKLIKMNDLKNAKSHVNYTLLFGWGFMMTQGFLWYHLKATGLYVSSGIYASTFYAFTWIHAVHMVAGIITLMYLKKVLKPETQNLMQKAINVEKFWYSLEIIWIIMFVTLFVI